MCEVAAFVLCGRKRLMARSLRGRHVELRPDRSLPANVREPTRMLAPETAVFDLRQNRSPHPLFDAQCVSPNLQRLITVAVRDSDSDFLPATLVCTMRRSVWFWKVSMSPGIAGCGAVAQVPIQCSEAGSCGSAVVALGMVETRTRSVAIERHPTTAPQRATGNLRSCVSLFLIIR